VRAIRAILEAGEHLPFLAQAKKPG
jgi:hypothetical protein